MLCGACAGAAASPGAVRQPLLQAGLRHTEADVHFMTGMIPHHAQAVRMARLAETRSSRTDIRVLAERIIVAQRDEIAMMQMWLHDRGLPAPEAEATHLRMVHDGVAHDMLMPGMLSEEELQRLERASGVEFDRLFLTYMIRHHEGALIMAEELFAAPGAAQDEDVFRLASDIVADQSSEIDRMENILAELPDTGRAPQP